MTRVHYWKDLGVVSGYTIVIQLAQVDGVGVSEKVFEMQL
jgi:hypothetical protein